jgi:phage shock protein C
MTVSSFRLDKRNAKFLGVCAGLAALTGVDAFWIRLATVAAVLLGWGLPILIYFVIALVAPSNADVLPG